MEAGGDNVAGDIVSFAKKKSQLRKIKKEIFAEDIALRVVEKIKKQLPDLPCDTSRLVDFLLHNQTEFSLVLEYFFKKSGVDISALHNEAADEILDKHGG